MASTRYPASANNPLKLAVRLVFPTPPLPLRTAMVLRRAVRSTTGIVISRESLMSYRGGSECVAVRHGMTWEQVIAGGQHYECRRVAIVIASRGLSICYPPSCPLARRQRSLCYPPACPLARRQRSLC